MLRLARAPRDGREGARAGSAIGPADPVRRHLVPNLWALNFLLEKALGGGGTRSLRLDAQGKTLAQALLRCQVSVPRRLLDTIERKNRPGRSELLSPRGRR